MFGISCLKGSGSRLNSWGWYLLRDRGYRTLVLPQWAIQVGGLAKIGPCFCSGLLSRVSDDNSSKNLEMWDLKEGLIDHPIHKCATCARVPKVCVAAKPS